MRDLCNWVGLWSKPDSLYSSRNVLYIKVMADLIGLIFVIILFSGVLSSIETALFSVPVSRTRVLFEKKTRGSSALLAVKENMGRPIITIVVLNNVTNIVGSMFVGMLASDKFGDASIGVVSAVMTFLIIIFAEIIPKTFGENYAEPIALFVSGPLLLFTKIFAPVIWMFERFMGRFRRKKKIVSEEELKILSQLGHLEGSIEQDEHEIINRVFTLNDLTAKDIMTPRVMIEGIDSNKTVDEYRDMLLASPFSRLPVFEGSSDKIIGICQAKNLLSALAKGEVDRRVSEFTIDVLRVPEIVKTDELLRIFQKSRFHLAVVIDEFNGTSGIVTLEDVLEQLVGEIIDETDEVADLQALARANKNHDKEPSKLAF